MKHLPLLLLLTLSLIAGEARAGLFDRLAFASGEFGLGAGISSLTNPDGTQANYSNLALQGLARLPLLGMHRDGAEFGLLLTMNYYTLTNSTSIGGETDTGYLLGPGCGAYLRVWKIVVGAENDFYFARHYATGRQSTILSYTLNELKVFIGVKFNVIDRFGLSIMGVSGTGVVPRAQTGLSKDSPYQEQMIFLNVTYTPGISL